jgi:hypothetical protein
LDGLLTMIALVRGDRAARTRAEAHTHLAALELAVARLGAHNGADVASLRRVLGALRDSL